MAAYVKELDDIIAPLMEFFGSLKVEGEIITTYEESHGDFNKMMELSKDMNATVLAQMIGIAERGPDEKYKQAYINWLKLNLLLFTTVPYWRSRLGHMLWYAVCTADPNAYYPLAWEEHYDPRNWYLPGEPQRPADNNKISAFSLPD